MTIVTGTNGMGLAYAEADGVRLTLFAHGGYIVTVAADTGHGESYRRLARPGEVSHDTADALYTAARGQSRHGARKPKPGGRR